MAVLEDNLRVTHGEAIDVANPAPQNKRVVIEAEIGGVTKGNLADLRPETRFDIGE